MNDVNDVDDVDDNDQIEGGFRVPKMRLHPNDL